MKILGIDPGLRTTGFGIIHKKGNSLVYIASGTVKTPAEAGLPLRLQDDLRRYFRNYCRVSTRLCGH